MARIRIPANALPDIILLPQNAKFRTHSAILGLPQYHW
jgi:hypothetical protein